MLAEASAVAQIGAVSKQTGLAQAQVSSTQGIHFFIDAPADNATVSGIGVIYGWAFAETEGATIKAIQVSVDGKSYGSIPCCSKRTDVAESYRATGQYVANAYLSGWGLLFNFSMLDEGNHWLEITVQSSHGGSVTHQRPVSVVKTGGFGFLSCLDLTQATVSINADEVILQQVLVTDKLSQQFRWVTLKLRWSTGLQSLTLFASETL